MAAKLASETSETASGPGERAPHHHDDASGDEGVQDVESTETENDGLVSQMVHADDPSADGRGAESGTESEGDPDFDSRSESNTREVDV